MDEQRRHLDRRQQFRVDPLRERRALRQPLHEVAQVLRARKCRVRTCLAQLAGGEPGSVVDHDLDEWAHVLRTGVAFEREESTAGLVCVAAPVLGLGNEALAAISVAGPTGRFRPDRFATQVRAAATGLSSTLIRRNPPS
ncbi:IclR family transcriptional regulator C-terminal domain-containing protein [Streptomyces sp. NPDC059218]|uniref:IclR family transcriptional regulator domain-containing protein n=1 Tax=unclassified Streptomyces TaxID=2593676 RepID=UPI003690085E